MLTFNPSILPLIDTKKGSSIILEFQQIFKPHYRNYVTDLNLIYLLNCVLFTNPLYIYFKKINDHKPRSLKAFLAFLRANTHTHTHTKIFCSFSHNREK